MGRINLTEENRFRFVVEVMKVTFPNGSKRTTFAATFDPEGYNYLPDSDVLNEVIPYITKKYFEMINNILKEPNNIEIYLDKYLNEVSKYVILGKGFKDVLADDLNISKKIVKKLILKTSWLRNTIIYIKNEFKKNKKKNAVKYAESVRQLVELFGIEKASTILKRSSIRMGRSTIQALCKVAGEPSTIKKMIKDGELKLTIAFLIPKVNLKEREKIAKRLCGMKYSEAKAYLKRLNY